VLVLLAVVGFALVALGAFFLLRDPSGTSDMSFPGIKLRFAGPGLPLIIVGVIVVVVTVQQQSSGQRSTSASGRSLTIYSSLPGHEANGGVGVAPVSTRTQDMEAAMSLALNEDDKKAGKFSVNYRPLDEADQYGDLRNVEHNAHLAADDPNTAVYIGDYSSTSTIKSIPILSGDKDPVPQISPSSTKVGLTTKDPMVDIDEPDKYYRKGDRNFVRIIPNDYVQAAALMTRMRQDGCTKLAMVYDGGDYSVGLTQIMIRIPEPARVFLQIISPNAGPISYNRWARLAKRRGADCFQYTGANNPNLLDVFRRFASELPEATLYDAGAALGESSFTDPASAFAGRVRAMLPPRELGQQDRDFRRRFREANEGREPDPYAVYGYEAMKLAIAAIERTKDGTRSQIRDELFRTRDQPSFLGTYSIDADGDTTLIGSDVSTIDDNGGLNVPTRAVRKKDLEAAVDKVKRAS
jgi:branched-chain amino acid transport system substrate-binding protein